MRIIICGGPDTGKTHLAREMLREPWCEVQYGGPSGVQSIKDCPNQMAKALVRCADPKAMGGDAECEDWEANSVEVAGWLDLPGPWIIEGVKTVYALRRWLQMRHPEVDILSDTHEAYEIAQRNAVQPPCDRLIVLQRRHVSAGPPSPGHVKMRDGMHRKLDHLLERWPALRRTVEWR